MDQPRRRFYQSMDNRRYSDEEIAAIFQKASEGPQASPPHAAHEEGMTLAELQEYYGPAYAEKLYAPPR